MHESLILYNSNSKIIHYNDVGRATLFTNTTNTIAAATTTTATPVLNIEKHEISLKENSSQNENKYDVSLGKLGSMYNYCTHM